MRLFCTTAAHSGEPVTRDAFDALPDGARIVVTWDGGNGPHLYIVHVDPWGNRSINLATQSAVYVGSFEEARMVTMEPEPSERP